MKMSNVKVLIVEDEQIDANHIKNGLLKLKNGTIDRFTKENILIELIVDRDLKQVYNSIRQKITKENIDVVFLDLHLISDVSDGINIINEFMDDNIVLKLIPKFIISTDGNAEKNPAYSKTFNYANFIQKPDGNIYSDLTQAYFEIFDDDELIETLKTIVPMYIEIKKSTKVNTVLKNMTNILKDIKEDTADIKVKVELIDNMNQTMIKFFPMLISSEKEREKLKEFIINDMYRYLDDDLEDFFQKEEEKNKFLDAVNKEFKNIVEKDLKKGTWDTLKDSIKAIALSQDIEEENAALCAAKLTYKGYSGVYNFLKGNSDV